MSHYTARISIDVVEKTSARGTITGSTTEKREVTEIANIVVRAEDIQKLIEKLKAHLDLVDGE